MFALFMSWVARDDLPISIVCLCFLGVHSSCPVLVLLWQELLLQPRLALFRIEVRVDHLLQESISSLGCVSAVHQISPTGIGMPGREDRHPLGGESGLAVAEVYPGIGRPGGRAARNVIRDGARRLDDVAPLVLPKAAIGRGTISNSRNPQAGELLP